MAKKIARNGIFLAIIIVLSIVESYITQPLAFNIRLGLSNVVIMYTVLCGRKGEAVTLAVLKSMFVTLSRGVVAGVLSLSGGLLAVAIMLIIERYIKNASYSLLSVSGALFHNMGQLVIAAVILGSVSIALFYLPILLLSAVGCGLLTGIILRYSMPYLERFDE